MKPASAKNKGRTLQKWARDQLLFYGAGLKSDDIQSRSSGANGEDVMLSPKARKVYPVSIECKNRKSFSVYKDYEQAEQNNPNPSEYQSIVVIKQNKHKPLAVIDAVFLFMLLSFATGQEVKDAS